MLNIHYIFSYKSARFQTVSMETSLCTKVHGVLFPNQHIYAKFENFLPIIRRGIPHFVNFILVYASKRLCK